MLRTNIIYQPHQDNIYAQIYSSNKIDQHSVAITEIIGKVIYIVRLNSGKLTRVCSSKSNTKNAIVTIYSKPALQMFAIQPICNSQSNRSPPVRRCIPFKRIRQAPDRTVYSLFVSRSSYSIKIKWQSVVIGPTAQAYLIFLLRFFSENFYVNCLNTIKMQSMVIEVTNFKLLFHIYIISIIH